MAGRSRPRCSLSMPRITRPGRGILHEPASRGLPAERVVDEARDGGAVLRAGEAVGQAPVLEGVGRRPAAGLDIAQDLDGGGEARGGCHRNTTPELGRIFDTL